MRPIILKCILVFNITNIQTSDLYEPSNFDRIQEYITQTKIAQLFRYLLKRIRVYEKNDGGAATIQYQDLGKEAQHNIGIDGAFQLPVKKMIFPTSIALNLEAIAITTPHAIIIDEKGMDKEPWGKKKAIICHESVHVKYSDATSKFVLSTAMGVVIATALSQSLKIISAPKELNIFSFCAGWAAMTMCKNKYSRYCEQRADTEGLYATNCFVCISETKKREQQRKEDVTKYGYLSVKEIEEIEQVLKRHNRICSYHKIEKKIS